jgi:biotin carboxyl carrier protein/acetyl-CoA carboxylase beta subunit
VIAHSPSPDFAVAVGRETRALSEFRLEGVSTNIPFLRNILAHPDFVAGKAHTRWLDEHVKELATQGEQRQRFVEAVRPATSDAGFAGARVKSRDPLALFAHDAAVKAEQATGVADDAAAPDLTGPDGSVGVASPIQGTIVAINVAEGDEVREGQQVAVVEAMKMEHVITAPHSGIVRGVTMAAGDVVREGFPIVFVREAEVKGGAVAAAAEFDLDHIRDDLRENAERHALTLDENRPDAVARRHRFGSKMPRENIERLVDPGSFNEYWPLIVARQHQRNTMEELRRNTPADGVVAGMCSINGDLFDETRSRAALVHYDYTVLAGTQGGRNHYKQDRIFELAHRFRLPLILFGEGGGGRPGDDYTGPRVAIDTKTFTTFSQLSGLVPMISVVNGRCFAGNTALVACCDVIIATESTTIGMGGPAMIEGGGLGIYTPEEVGPISVQVPNGVIDIVVKDEFAAVDAVKKYLSYFQGAISTWEAHDQRKLRHLVPENRLRLYNMRDIVHTIADKGSVLEIREKFGIGIITAFMRIEGRPMGVIANNPHHLAGAIDSDGSDKCARFMHSAGPPLHAAVQRRRQHDGSPVHRGGAQGLRPRRPGDAGRRITGRLFLGGLADGGIRRHEHRGLGQARLSPGARRDRGCRDPPRRVRPPRCDGLRKRQGGQRRGRRRHRRRDRSRRYKTLDRQWLEASAAGPAAHGEKISIYRPVVSGLGRGSPRRHLEQDFHAGLIVE